MNTGISGLKRDWKRESLCASKYLDYIAARKYLLRSEGSVLICTPDYYHPRITHNGVAAGYNMQKGKGLQQKCSIADRFWGGEKIWASDERIFRSISLGLLVFQSTARAISVIPLRHAAGIFGEDALCLGLSSRFAFFTVATQENLDLAATS